MRWQVSFKENNEPQAEIINSDFELIKLLINLIALRISNIQISKL